MIDITRWTAENFGTRQAEHYAETIALAIEALHDGPETLGAKVRDEIGTGIRTLHVARQGRKGRYFVAFSVSERHIINVLRLLHDSMDWPRIFRKITINRIRVDLRVSWSRSAFARLAQKPCLYA